MKQSKNQASNAHYADAGTGMTPGTAARIFEPYFSTKKQGMGLGLAIVKRIVEEHGGKILVESAPGDGTRFFIALVVVPGKMPEGMTG